MIVALIFATITGVALASYLALSMSSLKLASRSFYANSAMNTAEIGIEQTLACYNQLDNLGSPAAWPSTATAATGTFPAFTGWTLNSGAASATATFSGFDVGAGGTGSVKVYAHYYDGSGIFVPVIVVKSTITQANGPDISKYIEVTLRKRSRYGLGMIAYGDIDWNGVPNANSWISDTDNNPATPGIPYTSSAQNTANVIVASINGDISLGSGTVNGYAKTGPDGTITGGTVQGTTPGDDPSRRTNDFNATYSDPGLPAYSAPNSTSVTASVKTTRIFGLGDPSAPPLQTVEGKPTYVYVFTGSGNINLTGTNTITMSGNVMFIMQGYSGVNYVIDMTGGQGVIIPNGSSMTVFTDGNIRMTGSSTTNSNPSPETMMIKGTNPTAQTITIGGTADIKAVIDAPHAAVSASGSNSFQGAIVADTINMNGTPQFIFDESLKALTTGNPYGISKWKELQTAAERGAYTSALNF